MSDETQVGREEHRPSLKGWLIVCGLAFLFLIYGLFMFLVVGDKGPPDWTFGVVEDVPGESVYSTHPGPPGSIAEPEPQHVSGKPPRAEINKGERTE